MASSSSILRRVFEKFDVIYCYQKLGRCASSWCFRNLRGYRTMSTTPPPSTMSPWLMLPPASDVKFYSLAEKKVLSMNKRSEEEESQWPSDEVEFVGSSHGWIALLNRRNNALFLSNPLTHRQIKLPPLHYLPNPSMNARSGRRNVSKVILSSSSPDDQECRAMMTFGPANRLAFCSPSPNSDSEEHRWTPIGNLHTGSLMRDGETTGECANVYDDLVYCIKRKVFSSITPCEFELDSFRFLDPEVSTWTTLDVWDPSPEMANDNWQVSSKQISVKPERGGGNSTRYWVKMNKGLLQYQCVQIPHLVYADCSDQLYIALRFLMLMNPEDGTTPVDRVPLCPFRGLAGYFPSKTVGFVLLKLDLDNALAEIVDDLDGLAMFVGINHSFALHVSDFPELKSDSIYFTDSKRIKRIYGRDDIGIYNYKNKTVAEVASSDEIGTFSPTPPAPGVVISSPMWFTPGSYYG